MSDKRRSVVHRFHRLPGERKPHCHHPIMTQMHLQACAAMNDDEKAALSVEVAGLQKEAEALNNKKKAQTQIIHEHFSMSANGERHFPLSLSTSYFRGVLHQFRSGPSPKRRPSRPYSTFFCRPCWTLQRLAPVCLRPTHRPGDGVDSGVASSAGRYKELLRFCSWCTVRLGCAASSTRTSGAVWRGCCTWSQKAVRRLR